MPFSSGPWIFQDLNAGSLREIRPNEAGMFEVNSMNVGANATAVLQIARSFNYFTISANLLTGRSVVRTRPLPLDFPCPSGLGQPGSIPALVLPWGGMAARHRKGVLQWNSFSFQLFSLATNSP
ncbi:hypothetical protein CSKR_113522 [Clonorchis sinensis]|uniref:Uncharacterized protein n=1 Tax=Clonorchis sinensis TaxID=79923 RepID=A0A419Q3L7_CLOSI|nr:hypothetical protein CSKR_113522 [Clonorchis sinensis]